MRTRLWWAAVAVLAFAESVSGQTSTYQPLGSWVSPEIRWRDNLRRTSAEAVKPGTRPELAGLRPRSVELLEDALLRKHPKLLQNSSQQARRLILRRYRSARGPLRGYMAEAMFVDRNGEWHYVRKPNATQHDVYRWIDGKRAPYTGQIKYHDSGTPSMYARDMLRDHRSPRFFIPDDHVAATKAHLRDQDRWRDYARIRGIGATSGEIRSATEQAARSIAREPYSVYTSFGAVLALSVAPTLFDWKKGDISSNSAMYQVARPFSLLGASTSTDYALRRLGKGALRGSLKGNVIVGSIVAVTQLVWLLGDNGWQQAFYRPQFYEEAVGGVNAVALAMAAGTAGTTMAADLGPWSPVVGIAAAIVAGTIGYVGGREAVHRLIEIIDPEILRRQERLKIEGVRKQIDNSIQDLQTLSLSDSCDVRVTTCSPE